jgi:outer membrane protein
MRTKKSLFLFFCLWIACNGFIHAQQKTMQEELEELRALTRKQNEILSKPVKADSTGLIIQPEKQKPVYDSNNQWSLEQCIQYAIEHNINIKQLQLQQEEAEIQQNTAKNSRLPNLNASLGHEWSFGKAQDLLGNYYDLNQSHSGISAQSAVPLFTGFRIPNQIARTKLDFEAAIQNLEKAKEDLSINITSLFLQALFTKELLNINEKQLELSKTQIQRTQYLVQAGNVPKSHLYDIEAQVAKDEASLVDAQNNLDIMLLDLAQSLELERNTKFDISVPNYDRDIITTYMNSLQPPDVIYENAVNFKPVIKGQEYKVESSKKGLKVAESGYYPQLDFTLGIGTNFFHIYKPSGQINPITNEPVILNPPLSEQFRNYASKLIGFNMSIPIFNRFQVRNQVRSAKIDILNQQLILENNKKTLYKEIQMAYKSATAAQAKYRASQSSLKAANESFEYARKRYELGNSTVFEFNEARTKLIQSQSELAQSKYEYILRAKILDFYNGIPIKL